MRAICSRWRSPTESPTPFSPTSVFKPLGKAFERPAEARGKRCFASLLESRLRPLVTDVLRQRSAKHRPIGRDDADRGAH